MNKFCKATIIQQWDGHKRRCHNIVKEKEEYCWKHQDWRIDIKKPTIQEVQAYIIEKNYNLDAEAFFYHYEQKGWKVGKHPMKRWKAAVALWGVQGWGKTAKSSADYRRRKEAVKSAKERKEEKEQWRGSRYADGLRAKTPAALKDLLKDGGLEAQRNGWLIKEILAEKNTP